MSIRINSNSAAIAARRYITKNERDAEQALRAIASGKRIVSAKDDAAGFAISESLRGQQKGVNQSMKNVRMAQSMIQTAEGNLNEQNNILIRLRELGVSSASDTIGDNERAFINKEATQLIAEFDRISQTARFGSKQLLNGSGEEFTYQVGPFKGPENTIGFKLEADTSATAVGIDSVDLSDQDLALDALEIIDEAVLKIADARSTFGAVQSRFQYTYDVLGVQDENLDAAVSTIADADIAEEVSKLTKAQILQDAGIMVLAQANQNTNGLQRLLS
ncbi:MAG: flagellin FliC [Bdellovibrionales bacterium]|nr:flagellin FliC [Bdellovibrionales bacterium]